MLLPGGGRRSCLPQSSTHSRQHRRSFLLQVLIHKGHISNASMGAKAYDNESDGQGDSNLALLNGAGIGGLGLYSYS